MASPSTDTLDVLVVGGGPAGVIASLRAARLGARTALITRDEFGGMAANDGPVPVRTLAHAARLTREARQLPRYGIAAVEPTLDYVRLLARVAEVTEDARKHSLLRDDLTAAGVAIHEGAGPARFVDPHTLESEDGTRLHAAKVILCTGGTSRPLPVEGVELTATHSDAWHLSAAPASLLVVGAGATGVQVASIFNAFGSHVTLVEVAPRILMSEDEDVSKVVSAGLAGSGVQVVEGAGAIERFERCAAGVRLVYSAAGTTHSLEATIAVVAAGWVAATKELNLEAAGVRTDQRGYIEVDGGLRTAAPHIFAAGDAIGRAMVVHEAVRDGLAAANNAVLGTTTSLPADVSPIGSFTDPEYASVGLTEAVARTGPRCRGGHGAVRLASAAHHRWAHGRVLQGDRRPAISAAFSGATSWGSARSSSHRWQPPRWPPRCGSSNSRWSRIRFPRYANALGRAGRSRCPGSRPDRELGGRASRGNGAVRPSHRA